MREKKDKDEKKGAVKSKSSGAVPSDGRGVD